MSKLLKRTFAFALVFCMLLSVIPAVSAETTDPVIYQFKAPATGETLSQITQEKYETGLTYSDGSKFNWYYLNANTANFSLDTNGLRLNVSATGWWGAIVIDVPAAGNYDLTAKIYAANTSANDGGVHLIKATTQIKEEIAGLGKVQDNLPSYSKVVESSIAFNLHNTTNGKEGYAYLGNVALEEGEYILIMTVNSKSGSGSAYMDLTSLTLTPGNDGSSFVDIVNNHTATVWGNNRMVYQLAADLYAPNADLVLKNIELALRGNDLTVNKISRYTGNMNKNASTARKISITDTVGNGVITANSITWPADQYSLPITVDTNAYKLTTVKSVFCAEPKARDGAVAGSKSFGFDIGLIAAAYGWDLSSVNVVLDVVVNGEDVSATCDYTDNKSNGKVTDWAAEKAAGNAEAVFYVDVANYELLAGKQLNFKITVSSNGIRHVLTPTYTVPAA